MNVTRPSYVRAARSRSGISVRQGAHHDAQTFTTTGLPRSPTRMRSNSWRDTVSSGRRGRSIGSPTARYEAGASVGTTADTRMSPTMPMETTSPARRRVRQRPRDLDRKTVVWGKSVYGRVELGDHRRNKKKKR